MGRRTVPRGELGKVPSQAEVPVDFAVCSGVCSRGKVSLRLLGTGD